MTPRRTFALYPEERHWWSFNDYGAVVDVVGERLALVRAALPASVDPASIGLRVLEFGPGSSTLALLEGGAASVDACEDDPHWAAVHRERLVSQHRRVSLHEYVWAQKLSVSPEVDGRTYDLALIDGPKESAKRLPVLKYALERCEAVLMPVDDSKGLVHRLEGLAKSKTHDVRIWETGPLAGSFALITRKARG